MGEVIILAMLIAAGVPLAVLGVVSLAAAVFSLIESAREAKGLLIGVTLLIFLSWSLLHYGVVDLW